MLGCFCLHIICSGSQSRHQRTAERLLGKEDLGVSLGCGTVELLAIGVDDQHRDRRREANCRQPFAACRACMQKALLVVTQKRSTSCGASSTRSMQLVWLFRSPIREGHRPRAPREPGLDFLGASPVAAARAVAAAAAASCAAVAAVAGGPLPSSDAAPLSATGPLTKRAAFAGAAAGAAPSPCTGIVVPCWAALA